MQELDLGILDKYLFASRWGVCKGEAINLIPHYMIDNISKTVKSSHQEKLQIIQNINNLMF